MTVRPLSRPWPPGEYEYAAHPTLEQWIQRQRRAWSAEQAFYGGFVGSMDSLRVELERLEAEGVVQAVLTPQWWQQTLYLTVDREGA